MATENVTKLGIHSGRFEKTVSRENQVIQRIESRPCKRADGYHKIKRRVK